jgi:hypothetical protein
MRPKLSGLFAVFLLLLLTSCRQEPGQRGAPETSGAALEQAALKAGAIHSGTTVDPAGLFEGDHGAGGDSLCLTHSSEGYRFDVSLTLDEKQRCAGGGIARRAGETLVLDFDSAGAGGGCTMVVDYDGDRVAFPGATDKACEKLCTGRASFAGVGLVRTDGECRRR